MDDPRTEVLIPVIEERLEVGREVVQTGHAVRLRKQVETFQAEVRDEAFFETVEVERVPVGRVVTDPPPTREEGDVTVVPVLLERLVTRVELVLVEEIRLTRRRQAVPVGADVPLRRETVVVERFDPDTGHWLPEPAAELPTNPSPFQER